MTYLYCDNCGEIFPEEDARELWDTDGYSMKTILACPNCRNTELVEAEECKICGEPLPPSNEYCHNCFDTLNRAWINFVETVMDLRLKNGEKKSADFTDCEDVLIEWLDNSGVL